MKQLGLLCCLLLLAGCGDKDEELSGERRSVILAGAELTPEVELQKLTVELGPAYRNRSWAQLGGNPAHALGHLFLDSSDLTLDWQVDIADEVISPAVVAEGKIFVIDSQAQLSALRSQDGQLLWQVSLRPQGEDSSNLTGGIAFAYSALYVATSYGQVLALAADDGSILWQTTLSGSARSAPTIHHGRVMVVTIDNQTVALSARTGEQLWSHTGLPEQLILLGNTAPALNAELAVVTYSSGEVFGLRVENGFPLWFDSVVGVQGTSTLSSVTDILASPVVDQGLSLVVGQGDLMLAIDQQSGLRTWDLPAGGVDIPWISGEFIFALISSRKLMALTHELGEIIWLRTLPQPPEEEGYPPTRWTGPVAAGGLLWVASSSGELLGLSSQDGSTIMRLELPAGTLVAPVVAEGTLYLITQDGYLLAYR